MRWPDRVVKSWKSQPDGDDVEINTMAIESVLKVMAGVANIGGELRASPDGVNVQYRPARMPSHLVDELIRNKAELLALLHARDGPSPACDVPDLWGRAVAVMVSRSPAQKRADLRFLYENVAAVLQHCAEFPREAAERTAFAAVRAAVEDVAR